MYALSLLHVNLGGGGGGGVTTHCTIPTITWASCLTYAKWRYLQLRWSETRRRDHGSARSRSCWGRWDAEETSTNSAWWVPRWDQSARPWGDTRWHWSTATRWHWTRTGTGLQAWGILTCAQYNQTFFQSNKPLSEHDKTKTYVYNKLISEHDKTRPFS